MKLIIIIPMLVVFSTWCCSFGICDVWSCGPTVLCYIFVSYCNL